MYKGSQNSLDVYIFLAYCPRIFKRDARGLDHKTLVEFPKRAVGNVQEAQSPAGVAKVFSLTRTAVCT